MKIHCMVLAIAGLSWTGSAGSKQMKLQTQRTIQTHAQLRKHTLPTTVHHTTPYHMIKLFHSKARCTLFIFLLSSCSQIHCAFVRNILIPRLCLRSAHKQRHLALSHLFTEWQKCFFFLENSKLLNWTSSEKGVSWVFFCCLFCLS